MSNELWDYLNTLALYVLEKVFSFIPEWSVPLSLMLCIIALACALWIGRKRAYEQQRSQPPLLK